MSIVRGSALAFATLACTAALLFAIGCTSCTTQPQTNERKGPDLVLNLVDTTNSQNNLPNIPAQRNNGSVPAATPPHVANNYNFVFGIVTTDPGGISSFDYSLAFTGGNPCNPDAGGPVTNNISSIPAPGTIPPNADGTVPNTWFAIAFDSAAAERTFWGCSGPTFGNTLVPGQYTVKAHASNPSGKKSDATWLINIP